MAKPSYNIAFIGSGNVAWHLSRAFEQAGHDITEVFSRDIQQALALTHQLENAKATNSLNMKRARAGVFFVSVPDDALEDVLDKLVVPDRSIVIHTAGTKPMEVLQKFHMHGVFYPVQTFSKSKLVNLRHTPVCLEWSDMATSVHLKNLANGISDHVRFVDSDSRKLLHISAVFACNFTNHLFIKAKDLLEKSNLEFGILRALINETVEKAIIRDPYLAQTGPAVRNDQTTIKDHLEILSKDDELTKIYLMLTDSIIKTHLK